MNDSDVQEEVCEYCGEKIEYCTCDMKGYDKHRRKKLKEEE